MARVAERRDAAGAPTLADRNRRLAVALVAWVVLLCLVSVIVVWVRN